MSNSLKLFLVVGARPNFMKMAPLYFELKNFNCFEPVIVHTGQHYDYEMSRAFFEDLDLPEPHHFLGVGSASHAQQTAKIMIEFEKVLLKEKPGLIIVFGDVNSTLACSLTAKKLFIPVAHVEAGLRSFDETMPEEINRRLTDAISLLLFTPSPDGDENLIKEGIDRSRIHLAGNIMIDSLVTILKKTDEPHEDKILQRLDLQKSNYVLVTLHRPCNVDDKTSLAEILDYLNILSRKISVVFPVHPRTKKNIKDFGISREFESEFRLLGPMRYTEFMLLEKNARFVLTDSGGIQEETTYLGVACLTLRPSTERPITITEGTNQLVDVGNIAEKVEVILSGQYKTGKVPRLWDGKTAGRIVQVLRQYKNMGITNIE